MTTPLLPGNQSPLVYLSIFPILFIEKKKASGQTSGLLCVTVLVRLEAAIRMMEPGLGSLEPADQAVSIVLTVGVRADCCFLC